MGGRLEYKFLVPNGLADQIRADLLPYMEPDSFGGPTGEYTVRSVYYDTPRFDCYHEKLAGLQRRTKFRIRGYDRQEGGSIVFLEIKRKNGDTVNKSRAPLLYSDLDSFFSSKDYDKYIVSLSGTSREKSDANYFLYHYYRHGLRPAVLVTYDREAYHGKFDRSLRVTLDKDIRGSMFPNLGILYDEDCLKYAMSRHFVLEVKFFRCALPVWVRSLISRYDLPRMALSKFTICIDSQDTPRKSCQMRSGVFSPVRITA